jgi:uroporphyrin-III C-methyltransferase/precorrin-2 dehydrogenase/sirohydrochlorin ferrochelatase
MTLPAAPARYPLFLDLAGRQVLVVGGGPVAARRAAGLVRAGAAVTVIAPHVCEDLAELVTAGEVRWQAREGGARDVASGPAEGGRWWLVHTATGDVDTDSGVAAEADRHGVWCVRADRGDASAAHTPAVAAGPDGVAIAVSGGGDPGRARALRDALAELLATGRMPLRRTRRPAPAPAPHPEVTTGSLGDLPDSVGFSGTPRPRTHHDAARHDGAAGAGGRVVLVGGGPGDPGLITVAGRQWLARADVVVTDRLGPVDLLAELADDVEVIDVGKTAGHHPIPQEQINAILVEQAQRGRTVIRLKGGDPFVMGRGGEEALHCLAHGVPVAVVPGVTSAVSVPAAAGIPVTHRGITSSFVVTSGHAGAGSALQAARSAPEDATLVLLMGLSTLARTARELVAAGRSADTPVAVISEGSTPRQRTVTGTLATIADAVATASLPSPALIVVGEVVRLREALAGDPAEPHCESRA